MLHRVAAGRAVLEREVPRESGRFGALMGQSHHSSVSPLISFIAALLFSPVPYRVCHKSLPLPCC